MDKQHRQEIGQRIRDAREQKEMTQPQLTIAVLGTDRAATVADWESGKRMPDAPTFGRLADVLGVSTDWLLGRPQEGIYRLSDADKERIARLNVEIGKVLDRDPVLREIAAHLRQEEPTGRAEGAGDETQRRLADAAQNQALAARLRAEQKGKANPVRRRAAGGG